MTNRGMIKWQPFSSVVPSNHMVNTVLKTKNKIKMPILSEDQKEELQRKMLSLYNNGETTNVIYYKDGRLYKITGKITTIDKNAYKLIINEKFSIFFSQITDFS